jgi:arylsulfatase A-like enzyme
MDAGAAPPERRLWTVLLIALALTFPLGTLLQPWLWPSRSNLPAVPRRLNAPVVLITVAGLRADRLGHLGAARTVTPALDRMAEQGISFRVCYSASNQDAASAAALLTGNCPARTGVQRAGDTLKPGQQTLAERFATVGYRTAAVVSNPELLDAGLAQGFTDFAARPLAQADAVVDAGLAAIDAAHDEPWLLWLDFSELLAPYGGAALDVSALAPDAPPGFGSDAADYDLSDAELKARGWGPQQLGWMTARYDAALARLDAAIGRLLDTLQARNRLEMLTVCVTGLRGERLDERPTRVFTHGVDLFEPSLRVPLLFRLPAQQSRGLQLTRLAQGLDVAPTLAEICLRGDSPGALGRSLKPAIQSQYVVNKGIFAQGLVSLAKGQPARAALAVRTSAGKSTVKAIVAADGALLGAYYFPQDPREVDPLPLQPQQLTELRRQWPAALGEQATCLGLNR